MLHIQMRTMAVIIICVLLCRIPFAGKWIVSQLNVLYNFLHILKITEVYYKSILITPQYIRNFFLSWHFIYLYYIEEGIFRI